MAAQKRFLIFSFISKSNETEVTMRKLRLMPKVLGGNTTVFGSRAGLLGTLEPRERYCGLGSTNIGQWDRPTASCLIWYRVELSGFRHARPQSTRFPFGYGGW